MADGDRTAVLLTWPLHQLTSQAVKKLGLVKRSTCLENCRECCSLS